MRTRHTLCFFALALSTSCRLNNDQAGTQVGDDGEGTTSPYPCGGLRGISKEDTAITGHDLTPREWRDSLSRKAGGTATVRYQLEAQTCELKLKYELTTRRSSEQLWLRYLTDEVTDGQCTAERGYFIDGMEVLLDIPGLVNVDAWVGGFTTPREGQDAISSLSDSLARTGKPSTYTFNSTAIEELCLDSGTLGPGSLPQLTPDVEDVEPGSSCITCLESACGTSVKKCDSAEQCSPFTECARDCGADPECAAACPQPFCDMDSEAGCYILDCRNWDCEQHCGAEPPSQVDTGSDLTNTRSAYDAGTTHIMVVANWDAGGYLLDAGTTADASSTDASDATWNETFATYFLLTRDHESDAAWSGTIGLRELHIEL